MCKKMKKQRTVAARASHMMRGKIIQAENNLSLCWNQLSIPNDRVAPRGDNQKQATFLFTGACFGRPGDRARSDHVDPCRFPRKSHLDLFERVSRPRELKFRICRHAECAVGKDVWHRQSVEDRIDSRHILNCMRGCSSISFPMFVLSPRRWQMKTATFSPDTVTEDTPILVEATAFKDGIVIVAGQ